MGRQIEFRNVTGHSIWLPGPNGEKVQFTKFQVKLLDEWYSRYVPKYLTAKQPIAGQKLVQQVYVPKPVEQKTYTVKQVQATVQPPIIRPINKVVGAIDKSTQQATHYYNQLIQNTSISISNDIGVGILSYNRLNCIERLVTSIRKHTDLTRTTVFISDESTDNKVKDYLKSVNDMVIISGPRLGIAGNSNRLLRCLSRFKYKILLNDDVEIMKLGWDTFYKQMMQITGLHHFCYRQPGVYGASSIDGSKRVVNGVSIQTITDKPHGAVMAFDQAAYDAVGHFDSSFGIYGMEHVDWSNRVSLSGIQLSGYHDVAGSDVYFKIHSEPSSTENKSEHLNKARALFNEHKNNRNRIFVNSLKESRVPSISYIIPFRGTDRNDCIKTVINNVKAQKFPEVEIVVVEQDDCSRFNSKDCSGISYVLAQSSTPFNKSLAFNSGVATATNDKVILHDADMLVYDGYSSKVNELLDRYDGLHICKNVLYLDRESTINVNKEGKLYVGANMERSVKYFEGGSLACKRKTYVDIGGFCEEFVGYGNEDCEFFSRLSSVNFFNERSIDLIHLWHDRTTGWKTCHERNKLKEAELRKRPMAVRCDDLKKFLVSKYKI